MPIPSRRSTVRREERRDGRHLEHDALRTRLRLVAPMASGLPQRLGHAATGEQRAVLDALAEGADVLVHGAPGSGCTALALEAALGARDCVVLAPRRATADRLRDAVAAAGRADSVRAVTPAGLSFAVVREAARRAGRGEPTLVTGADQDALLRELIAAAGRWRVRIDPAAQGLQGFRDEVRDLVSRATELGLRPEDLHRLARERGRPAWSDAAEILRGYLDVLDLEARSALDAGPRFDVGRMIREAATIIAGGSSPAAALVVVDDAQDLTAAGIELVRALRAGGAQLLVTACPDAAVDTFRGALPDAAQRILAPLSGASPLAGRVTEHLLLTASHRTPPAARVTIDALRARLPLAGAPSAVRRARASAAPDRPGSDGPTPVAALRAPNAVEEARWIASVLRDRHHGQQVPYDDMAVICRSGGAVDELADLLQRQGLPVSAARRPRPLREERVVSDLLTIIELALSGTAPSAEEATELLRGPFGDADALRLRRIRRLLLRGHEAATPQMGSSEPDTTRVRLEVIGSAELLARALVEEQSPGLPEPGARDRAAAPVHRLRRMIAAVRALGAAPAAADALWAAWDAAHVAEGWRDASLETDDLNGAGARGRHAARRLDAIGSLFAAAERFTERRPHADALVFVEHIRTLAIAEDTLAVGAQLGGRVRVLTPAAIAGEQVDTVVIAHMQEGSWPNARLRSTLFGAPELALAVHDRGLPTEPAALRAVQRETVIADEIRLAVSALARARSRVLVTAVDGAEESPSALFEAIESTLHGAPWVDDAQAMADPGPAPDPRRLVAALRRRILLPTTSAAEKDDAARLLARLAEAGAPGADPADWYHQSPSSEEPLLDDGAPVRLSPSALERAHACPQAWLLERAGGTTAAGPLQSIGTAVHRIAQDHPAGSRERGPDGEPADLLAQLTSLLAPLHLAATWSTRRMLVRAEEAVRLLAQHLEVTGTPLAVEAPFTVDLDGVELRGSIDRIEGDATGLRVVDLKTGAVARTAADAESDLQLAAYQAAIRDGALDDQLGMDAAERLDGAQLVYVGTGARRPVVRTQGALTAAEDPRWFDALVADVAEQVRGAQVPARPNSHCDRCAVRRTCALWPEGQQL